MIVTEVCFSCNAVELFSLIKTIRTEVDTKFFFPQRQIETSKNSESKPVWSADKQRAVFYVQTRCL